MHTNKIEKSMAYFKMFLWARYQYYLQSFHCNTVTANHCSCTSESYYNPLLYVQNIEFTNYKCHCERWNWSWIWYENIVTYLWEKDVCLANKKHPASRWFHSLWCRRSKYLLFVYQPDNDLFLTILEQSITVLQWKKMIINNLTSVSISCEILSVRFQSLLYQRECLIVNSNDSTGYTS